MPRSRPQDNKLGVKSSLENYLRKIFQEILVEKWRSVTGNEMKLTYGCIND